MGSSWSDTSVKITCFLRQITMAIAATRDSSKMSSMPVITATSSSHKTEKLGEECMCIRGKITKNNNDNNSNNNNNKIIHAAEQNIIFISL